MTGKEFAQEMRGMALLAHGEQVATDGGGVLGAIPTAKAARDPLLHLKHTQVALGQVVVKRYVEIILQGQRSAGMTRLATRLLPTCLAQALRLPFPFVTARRPVRIVAILPKLRFHFPQAISHLAQRFLRRRQFFRQPLVFFSQSFVLCP